MDGHPEVFLLFKVVFYVNPSSVTRLGRAVPEGSSTSRIFEDWAVPDGSGVVDAGQCRMTPVPRRIFEDWAVSDGSSIGVGDGLFASVQVLRRISQHCTGDDGRAMCLRLSKVVPLL